MSTNKFLQTFSYWLALLCILGFTVLPILNLWDIVHKSDRSTNLIITCIIGFVGCLCFGLASKFVLPSKGMAKQKKIE